MAAQGYQSFLPARPPKSEHERQAMETKTEVCGVIAPYHIPLFGPYTCTLEPDHRGCHVAASETGICATWNPHLRDFSTPTKLTLLQGGKKE